MSKRRRGPQSIKVEMATEPNKKKTPQKKKEQCHIELLDVFKLGNPEETKKIKFNMLFPFNQSCRKFCF